MPTLELIVDVDQNGKPVVSFPTRKRNPEAPEDHEKRMDWIKASFESFYSKIMEYRSYDERN